MAPKRAPAPPATREVPWALAAVSEVSPETAHASWEVRGYSLLDKTKGKKKRSPVLVQAAGARFLLEVIFGGNESADEGMFSVFCCRDSDTTSGASSVSARARIKVFGTGGVEMFGITESHAYLAMNSIQGWGKSNFGRIQTLESPTYLVNDTLVFGLEVTAWAADHERQWTLPAAPGHDTSATPAGASNCGVQRAALAEDLAALLAGGQATDVEVRGGLDEDEKRGQAVKAHRVVLAARSPVFNRMLLGSGMRESQPGAGVSLEGADHAITQRFIRFLYTDELDAETLGSPDALCHLLALAHRFEVRSLLQLCSARLTVSEDTAIDRLMMAEQFGLRELKEQILDFVCSCRQRLVQVQQTEAFERMSRKYPQLMVELFAYTTQPAEKRRRVSAAPAPAEA